MTRSAPHEELVAYIGQLAFAGRACAQTLALEVALVGNKGNVVGIGYTLADAFQYLANGFTSCHGDILLG